jgi:hypothetical protein
MQHEKLDNAAQEMFGRSYDTLRREERVKVKTGIGDTDPDKETRMGLQINRSVRNNFAAPGIMGLDKIAMEMFDKPYDKLNWFGQQAVMRAEKAAR